MTSATGSNSIRSGLGAQGWGCWPRAQSPEPRACVSGLTLIEILVSVAILASAMVLIMQALARGASALNLARNRLSAYRFSVAKMADLELSAGQPSVPRTEGQFRAGRDEFHWRVEAASSPDEPQLELVNLIVAWDQGRHTYESQVSALRPVPAPAPK